MVTFVHIGYHKTATTWLQKKVFPSHPQIRYWSVHQPRYAWLKEIATDHDFEFDAVRFRSTYLAYRDRVDKNIGISWEGYVGDPFTGAWDSKRNADRLKVVFPDAKIVICIRNQLDMIDSLYRQYVHEGGACTLTRFLELEFPSRVVFSLDYLRYERVIRYYNTLFGTSRVFVGLYEDLRDRPEKFLDELFSFIGVGGCQFDHKVVGKEVNVSMSVAAVTVARWVNRLVASQFNPAPIVPPWVMSARMVRRILQRRLDPLVLRRISGRGCSLNPELRESLREFFKESNQTLSEQLNLPLGEYDYPL